MKLYNLLMSGHENAWSEGHYVFELKRYLEYTDADLSTKFKDLDDDEVRKTLLALPTLFAYEARVKGDARVGWITNIGSRGAEIRLTFQFDPVFDPIPPEKLEDLTWDLDIGRWEMNRTHWALKKRDLLAAVKGREVDGRVPPYATTDAKSTSFDLEALARHVPPPLDVVTGEVRNALEKKEYVAGLDRLHTFATLLVRAFYERRGGKPEPGKSLNSLFGEYVKSLSAGGEIESEMTAQILRSSIGLLGLFNDVRNKRSLAHPNVPLNHNEAMLIFHHVINTMKFVDEIEQRSQAAKRT